MNLAFRAFVGVLFMLPSAGSVSAEVLMLTAADNVKVYADYYGDADKAKPIVLLFHQASSNAGEYTTIAPRLNALGFTALALDQRSGGSGWGRSNRTAKAFRGTVGFEQALSDMEAAVDWAKADGRRKVIVWGSSYSASLVFLLAAKHPEIAGVLAFSPGEYFSTRNIVRKAAAKVSAPIFVSSASDAGEIAEAKEIIDAAPASVRVQYRPKTGTHGSSSLRADSNPYGASENWVAVEAFLAKLK